LAICHATTASTFAAIAKATTQSGRTHAQYKGGRTY
ncbi:MAG: hypothetical protein JWP52_1349, partial [Rhizobacter sp.]|nr:hypothetical protein [Rhizobacter sp.]